MDRLKELKADSWFKERPECVRKAVIKYPGFYKYKLTTTGQIVRIYSYTEGEIETTKKRVCTKCQVLVLAEDNPGRSDVNRRVFGIPLNELERGEEIPEEPKNFEF